jgi:hypothetical protein
VRIIYVFLLVGSIQGLTAGTIGDPPILRETTDTYSGYLFAYDGTFGGPGSVSTWSFYAGEADPNVPNMSVVGHEITPVLLDPTNPNGWTITAIGTTRTVSGPGLYEFDFDVVFGSDLVTSNLTFGWYDGSSTSANQGTISFDRAATDIGVRDFTAPVFPVLGSSYTTKNDFTGANEPDGWSGGRIYSVQFDPPEDVPEPASLAMFLGGSALIACLRRNL